jgi:pimeloyl-ACP methyl ester carboxylesterase
MEAYMKVSSPTTAAGATIIFTMLLLFGLSGSNYAYAQNSHQSPESAPQVSYHRTTIDGIEIFYRAAGPVDAPAIVLLHGFPTSSQMYRDLIPRLADKYRVIAPDFPGFGQSAAPSPDSYKYSFEGAATLIDKLLVNLKVNRYALYVMDYGAPVGFQLAVKHPERVSALLVQNGNAYLEGIGSFWDPVKKFWKDDSAANRDAQKKYVLTFEATRWQYLNGVPDPTLVSPDAYMLDQAYLDRPGNADIQVAWFYDYQNNLPKYPEWQAYFRKHKPPTLVMWGKNDEIFLVQGAEPYRRDNPSAEVHILDTGHFALETHGPQIAGLIRDFLARQ